MKKNELDVHHLMEVEQTGGQNLALETVKQEAAGPFGPDLLPVLPSSEKPSSERGGTFENDKDCVGKGGEHFGKLHCTKRQRRMSKSENATVGQIASNHATAHCQAFISTDDVLDCVVNPQVTKIVAQL